jgi:hypothetical protein
MQHTFVCWFVRTGPFVEPKMILCIEVDEGKEQQLLPGVVLTLNLHERRSRKARRDLRSVLQNVFKCLRKLGVVQCSMPLKVLHSFMSTASGTQFEHQAVSTDGTGFPWSIIYRDNQEIIADPHR